MYYVAVCFEGNDSTKWDGNEVPGRTVVRLGWRGLDRLERAEIHWPKRKVGKVTVWWCVVLEGEEAEEEGGGGKAAATTGKGSLPWTKVPEINTV